MLFKTVKLDYKIKIETAQLHKYQMSGLETK